MVKTTGTMRMARVIKITRITRATGTTRTIGAIFIVLFDVVLLSNGNNGYRSR